MRGKVGLFFVCGLVLPLAFAATASAQMVVTPKSAKPGDVINLRNFSGNFVTAAGISGVVVRDGTRNGRVLRTTSPDARGNINVDIPLPGDLKLGWHLLVATQTIDANGRTKSFVPLRTRLRVVSASAGSAPPAGRGGPLDSPGSPLGLWAIGSALTLLATGAALTARKLRTLNRPQLGS